MWVSDIVVKLAGKSATKLTTMKLQPNEKVFPVHPLSMPHGVLVVVGSLLPSIPPKRVEQDLICHCCAGNHVLCLLLKQL
jgi:hypothetical protein